MKSLPCRSRELGRPGAGGGGLVLLPSLPFPFWASTPIWDLAPFVARACPMTLGSALMSEHTVRNV